MFYIYTWYKKDFLPRFKGWLFKSFFSNEKLKIGKNFQCDSFPDFHITHKAKIEIGNNVIFKRDVELRAHKNSKISIGSGVKVDRGVRLLSTHDAIIDIEKGVYHIGLYSVFNAGASICIKKYSSISGFVYLQSSLHRNDKGEKIVNQGYIHEPITIGEDVFVGAHSTIMAGVNIANGAVIGSNTVVAKNVKEDEIVMGVPGRTFMHRN